MTRGTTIIEDLWYALTTDVEYRPLDEKEQARFAAENAAESGLSEGQFQVHESEDPRWHDVWQKSDGTPEGDRKAYNEVFG